MTKYPINPNLNYWEENPQLQFIAPFNKVYDLDKGGELSSQYMYIVTFMCDPDENENKYFRMSEKVRKKNLKLYMPHLEWGLKEFKDALTAYPFECLNSIQRALKEEYESIKERAQLISDTPYTLDGYMKDEEGDMLYDKSGKPIWIKGTASQLDTMRKNTAKIYDDLDKTVEKYMSQRSEEVRVRGGRKRTAQERGDL